MTKTTRSIWPRRGQSAESKVSSPIGELRLMRRKVATGYEIEYRIAPDDDYIGVRIRTPRDDDWYGTGAVCFGIATTVYGDHSVGQAQRAMRGLELAWLEASLQLRGTGELRNLHPHRPHCLQLGRV